MTAKKKSVVPRWLTILAVAAPVVGAVAGWGASAITHAQNAAIHAHDDSVKDYWRDLRLRRLEQHDSIEDAQKQSEQ